MSIFEKDILIIGAGPAGLFCSFQAGLLGMSNCIVDIMPSLGGQCSALYPEKPIYDIPGFPSITGQDLIDRLTTQANQFKPLTLLGQSVDHLEKVDGFFIAKTSKNEVIKTKVVVIASGNGAFLHKKLTVENADKYDGKRLLYSVKDPKIFVNKVVAIAGGGDSAADWAINLSKIASKIYLIHRRDNLRCIPTSADKINEISKTGKIEKVIPYQIGSLSEKDEENMLINLYGLDGDKKTISVNYLLAFYGLTTNLGSILDWGIEIENKLIKVDPSTMQTSVEGIYAIGDSSTYSGKIKLILVGFSESSIAMHSAYGQVFPDKPFHFEYSTTKGIKN